MKIFYLSTTSFSCVDVNVLHHLSDKYDITYGVIIPSKNANFSKEELDDYCSVNNIKKSFFHLKHRYRDPRTILVYKKIVNNILKNRPDIIFVNNFDQIYFNILLLFLNKEKTIIAMHDVASHSGTSFNALATLSRTILYKKFKQFLTFSPFQASLLEKIKPDGNVHMIPLALEDFGEIPVSNKAPGVVNFLFFGNIKPYKGLDLLLKSISRIYKKNPSFKLTIAGRCDDWEEVYKPLIECKHLVDAHIRFIDNSEIPSFFGNTDYLILPYKDATQSGPLMIAYNYNIPSIASNIAGFREFIHDEKTGYLFDPILDESIDNVLLKVIANHEKKHSAMCSNVSIFKQENLAIEGTISAYDNLFKHVLETQL